MFRPRISLRWFLIGSAAIAILIGMGKRYYDDRQWLAAPNIAGSREEFNEPQFRQWHARQQEIREALRGSHIRWDGYLTGVDVLDTTDRSRLFLLSEATELEEFGGHVPLRDEDLLWAENHPNLRRLLSIEGITNRSLAVIGTCRKLDQLLVESSSITDAGLVHLSRLDQLEHLCLCRSPVTGRGLATLARLPHLSKLQLSDCPIDDEGLKAIGQLRHLTHLEIRTTNIDGVSDAGLIHLENLKQLRRLEIHDPPFTAATVRRLEGELPSATINVGIVGRRTK